MKHAENYEIMTTEEGVPVFVIDSNRSKPDSAILLYDGGKHATLFRNDHDVILLDYLPDDFVLFIDESHVTLPQVRGMSGGDFARKKFGE